MNWLDFFLHLFQPPVKVVPPPKPKISLDQAVKQMEVQGWRDVTPSKNPTPASSPIPQPHYPTAQDFQSGFSKFGSGNPPIATASSQLAQGARMLPSYIDPYLGGVISLMEAQGGLKPSALNNYWGIRGIQNDQRQFINYPNLQTAILGNSQQKGFYRNILESGLYPDFLKTGHMEDFFKVATPAGPEYGNPSMPELLLRYNDLRTLFPQ